MLTNKQENIELYETVYLHNEVKIKTLHSCFEENFLLEYADRYIVTSSKSSIKWKYLLEDYSTLFLDYFEGSLVQYSENVYVRYSNSLKFYLSGLFIDKSKANSQSIIYKAVFTLKTTDQLLDRFFYEYLIITDSLESNKENIDLLLVEFPDIFTHSKILETIGNYISKEKFDICVNNYNKAISKLLYSSATISNSGGLIFKKNGELMSKFTNLCFNESPNNIPINNTTTEILNTMTTKPDPTLTTLASREMILGKATSRSQDTIEVTVNVHKESIQNAATIEAGNIALTFLTERLKNVLPPQAQLFLYLPGSEIMIATVATIGIHTFAPDNPKAMIAAKAMTTAAYGKLFAKINVSKLIEDIIDKIPTDTLLPSKD